MARTTLILIIILFCLKSSFCQTYHVSGRVLTDSHYVSYAAVVLYNSQTNTVIDSTTTDSIGYYQLDAIVGVDNDEPTLPTNFELAQNHPNPFSNQTEILYKLNKQNEVTIKIYDILGREIKTLRQGEQNIGIHGIRWNGTNNNGIRVVPGIYLYQLITNREMQTMKMVYSPNGSSFVKSGNNFVTNSYLFRLTNQSKTIWNRFTIEIKNTDSTKPRIINKEFDNVTIQSDTTINFVVQEEKIYLDLSGRITKNNSPFYINGAARVPKGETLIIDPGVTILFKSGNVEYRDSCDFDWNDSTISIGFLRVDGKLIAEGTETDSIIFTKASSIDKHYWGCIYFSETADSNSIISFSRIEYASTISGVDPRVHGDGITCWFSSITLKSNLVLNCKDFGIYLQNSESLIENNIIKNCLYGVGTWAFDQYAYLKPIIRNNIIAKNSARGLLIFKPQPLIENNVICYNEDIGILLGFELLGKSKIINNIIWGNKNFQIKIDSFYVHDPDITYSCIENGWPGEGNININPKFFDIAVEDFHLLPDSPCINAGSPLQQYNDHDGSRNDIGAYGGPYGDW